MQDLPRPIGSGSRSHPNTGKKQTVTEIFQNALGLLGKNASSTCLILLVPACCMTLRRILEAVYCVDADSQFLWQFIHMAGGCCDNIIATGALAALFYHRSQGQDWSAARAIRHSAWRFPATLLYSIGLGIGIGVAGIFLIVPAIFVLCTYGLTVIVAPLEPEEDAFERSAKLTKRRFKRTFLFLVIVPFVLLAMLLACCWGAAITTATASMLLTGKAVAEDLIPLNTWLGGLLGIALIPLNTAILVQYYSDCQAVLAESDQ